MTFDRPGSMDSANALTSIAADLTDAAYTVVLRHGIDGSWIDLQLDVWRVLAASITESQRRASRFASAAEFLVWREMFVSELTDAAYRTALRYGLQRSFLDTELDLHVALREVVERAKSSTGLRCILAPGARAVANAVLSRLEQNHSCGQPAN
ncbi:MAG: hypothetical protein ACM3U2_20060 [Deltaproteobacteria bacterium]